MDRCTHRYRVTNAGDGARRRPARGHRASRWTALGCRPALGATLAPGARLTCTATVATTQDDLDFGGLEIAAEARAEAPGGDPDDPADDVVAVGPASVAVSQRPALRATLGTDRADGDRPRAGDVVAETRRCATSAT